VVRIPGRRIGDTELLDQMLGYGQLVIIPAVLTELLSDPKLPWCGRENSLRCAID
jgi:hypothetical protein